MKPAVGLAGFDTSKHFEVLKMFARKRLAKI